MIINNDKKFAGPTAHGVSDPAPPVLRCVFLIDYAHARPALGPPTPIIISSVAGRCAYGAPGRSKTLPNASGGAPRDPQTPSGGLREVSGRRQEHPFGILWHVFSTRPLASF